MITTINEFKKHLNNVKPINESMGDISLTEIENKRFNEWFINLLNQTFSKVESGADFSGLNVWNVSGDTENGYFIIQDENKNPYEVGFELFERNFEPDDLNPTSETIDYIETSNKAEAMRFIDVAKSYIHVEDVNERSDFDAVATIGKITKNITIELDLKHSMHSMERQGRSTEFIKNSDIKAAVDKATPEIVDLLINNTLNAGDPVWVYDSSNDLNVVGSLLANKKTDIITFKIITCMFHKNFYNKNNTYKVTV